MLDKKTILAQLKDRLITPQEAKKLLQQNDIISLQDVAIVGLSCKFPGAKSVETFWQLLTQHQSQIIDLPELRKNENLNGNIKGGFINEDISAFDAEFFDISDDVEEQLDPQQKCCLEYAYAAIEDAGYAPKSLANKKCGIYAGVGGGDYFLTQKNITSHTASGFLSSFLVARLSYFLNLTGPCLVIDTACTSALSAIHLAKQSLIANETDIMLVAAVNIISTNFVQQVCQATGILSPLQNCKPFDEAADGWVLGEGVGVLVLKRLSDAVAARDHIYGVIKGSGINQNGYSNGIYAPKSSVQSNLQTAVYKSAGILPETISYIEAQGVSNKIGDSIEIAALKNTFAKVNNYQCAISTIKPHIGHLLAASGMASIIKVLMSLKYKKIPPICYLENVNKSLAIEDSPFYLNTELSKWESHSLRRAAINGFGLTGANAHLVIEESPVTFPKTIAHPYYIFCLSAKTQQQLERYKKHYREFLKHNNTISLANLTYTLHVGRDVFEERYAVVISQLDELLEKLAEPVRQTNEVINYDNKNITSLLEQSDEKSYQLLARLWQAGYSIDWSRFYINKEYHRLALPTYPFARQKNNVSSKNNTSPQNSDNLKQLFQSYLVELIHQKLNVIISTKDYGKNFVNLGINSIYLIQLSDKIEQQFNIQLHPSIYFDHPNIEDLTQYVITHFKIPIAAFFTFYQPQKLLKNNSIELKSTSDEEDKLDKINKLIKITVNRVTIMSDILLKENTIENRAKYPLKKEVFDIAYDFYHAFNDFCEKYLEEKVLSRDFITKLHQAITIPFLIRSPLLKRFFEKPRGYAGDFETIKMIYDATPTGETLLDYWLDEWAQQLPSIYSVQNRRQYIRDHIKNLSYLSNNSPLPVMSIACGPASEILESITQDHCILKATCVDLDRDALAYVEKTAEQLGICSQVTCLAENVFRLSDSFKSFHKNTQKLIYSIGLIDYFDEEITIELLNQLYELLMPSGIIILGNISDQCPERYFSDYLLDWKIIYRSKQQMKEIFENSYFSNAPIEVTTYNDEDIEIQLYALSKKI